MIELKDILGWAITIAIAISIFLLFQKNQLRVARHTIVRLLEQDIINILKAKSAQVVLVDSSDEKNEVREFRFVLDNLQPWEYEKDMQAPVNLGYRLPISRTIDGQRYWLIRRIKSEEKEQYVASQALQETLLWFRRVAQAHKDRVIISDDLVNLWRFLLIFGAVGRLNYFSQYFQGYEEVQDIVYVINETLQHCLVCQRRRPVAYFNQYVTEEDLQILSKSPKERILHQQVARMENK